MRFFSTFVLLAILSALPSGCVHLPQRLGYTGPDERPPSVNEYYGYKTSFTGFRATLTERTGDYTKQAIQLETTYGPVRVDFYQRHQPNDNLILIFPILGGRYLFESHFAAYFARSGFDTAIVHRNADFKDPSFLPRIEEVFRTGVVRDRIVLDFFEQVYEKRSFGSFGISRGALNVSILAGVDKRLKNNVLVLGGTDILKVLKESDEKGVVKYRERAKKQWNISDEEFYSYMEKQLKTDPKVLANYIDASSTMLILAVFDKTVPFATGLKLRRQIGEPETIFIPANHYTSLLFTQFPSYFMPETELEYIIPSYIESQAVMFYQDRFEAPGFGLKNVMLSIMKAPFTLAARVRCTFNSECRHIERKKNDILMAKRKEERAIRMAKQRDVAPRMPGVLAAPQSSR